MGTKRILVLLSTAGGGDRQPVVSLAVALHERGHDVTFLCDSGTVDLVASTGIETVAHHVEQVGFISRWIKQLSEEENPPNPFREWGTLAHSEVRRAAADLAPDVIVSSLFCMGLADTMAEDLRVPWCFVNPSFYFGEHSQTTWEDDWYGSFVPRLAQDCFVPLVDSADMVLHATDPIFDSEPRRLPLTHHYVGFLLWESGQRSPNILTEPGDPWALVTASTARPADEEAMLRSAVSALADRPLRTILTLPKHNVDDIVAAHAFVTGYAPHTPILRRSIIAINQAGHGVVSKCLTYGVPMVLLPWDADQPGVARRAQALGVAAVVPRAEVSTATVTAAVSEVLDSDTYRANAKQVSGVLAERSPADTACNLIEQM